LPVKQMSYLKMSCSIFLRKWDVGIWTGLIWLRIGKSGGDL